MRIQCPECKTEYRVDEAKIPSKGVYTRCKHARISFSSKKRLNQKDLNLGWKQRAV